MYIHQALYPYFFFRSCIYTCIDISLYSKSSHFVFHLPYLHALNSVLSFLLDTCTLIFLRRNLCTFIRWLKLRSVFFLDILICVFVTISCFSHIDVNFTKKLFRAEFTIKLVNAIYFLQIGWASRIRTNDDPLCRLTLHITASLRYTKHIGIGVISGVHLLNLDNITLRMSVYMVNAETFHW